MAAVKISDLVGKTLTQVTVNSSKDEILFVTDQGVQYKMLHHHDCCETVDIEDIDGDLDDLVGSPILVAEEVTSNDLDEHPEIQAWKLLTPEKFKAEQDADSFTWTFYKLDTAKGGVCIRWFGSSNGYYSESVDLVKADEEGDFSRY